MHSHFQILLRGVLGAVKKSGMGSPYFMFLTNFLKPFEGVHHMPPPPPSPPCVHLCYSIKSFFLLSTDPLRSLERGCYDPVVETLTVNSRCISDRHCQKLKNTECKSSIFEESIRTCRCVRGTLPTPPDPVTGLVLGCEESVRAELLSISSCKMRFSIKERKVK
jgi:hypothetical protein